IAICRDSEAARRRFGVSGDATGEVWTRTGRAFFADDGTREALLGLLRSAVAAAGLWNELSTDWLLLDAEIMPWSAKAGALIDNQYAPVAVSARAGLGATADALMRARSNGIDTGDLLVRFQDRAARASLYARVWKPYVWPVSGVGD